MVSYEQPQQKPSRCDASPGVGARRAELKWNGGREVNITLSLRERDLEHRDDDFAPAVVVDAR